MTAGENETKTTTGKAAAKPAGVKKTAPKTAAKSAPKAARKSSATTPPEAAPKSATPATAASAAAKPADGTAPQPASGAGDDDVTSIAELVERVSERAGVRKNQARDLVTATLTELGVLIDEGIEMRLPGLGRIKYQRVRETPKTKISVIKVRQRKANAPDDKE